MKTPKNFKHWKDELESELSRLQAEIQCTTQQHELLSDDKNQCAENESNTSNYNDNDIGSSADNNRLRMIEDINHIPKMILRIMNELKNSMRSAKYNKCNHLCYDYHGSNNESQKSSLSVSGYDDRQHHSYLQIVQLLSSLTIGFGQCFLTNLSIEKKNIQRNDDQMRTKNFDEEYFHQAEERLYGWIADTIYEVLHSSSCITPSLQRFTYENHHFCSTSTMSNNSKGKTGHNNNAVQLHPYRIPVLDALLATTGKHNGLSHELILQQLRNQCFDYNIIDDTTNKFDLYDIEFDNGCNSETDTLIWDMMMEEDIDKTIRSSKSFLDFDARTVCKDIIVEQKITNSAAAYNKNYSNDEDETDNQNGNPKLHQHCENNLFLGQIRAFLSHHDF